MAVFNDEPQATTQWLPIHHRFLRRGVWWYRLLYYRRRLSTGMTSFPDSWPWQLTTASATTATAYDCCSMPIRPDLTIIRVLPHNPAVTTSFGVLDSVAPALYGGSRGARYWLWHVISPVFTILGWRPSILSMGGVAYPADCCALIDAFFEDFIRASALNKTPVMAPAGLSLTLIDEGSNKSASIRTTEYCIWTFWLMHWPTISIIIPDLSRWFNIAARAYWCVITAYSGSVQVNILCF